MLKRILIIISRLLLFGSLLSCSDSISESKLPDPLIIEVFSKEYQWYFKFPGADNEFNTNDDIVKKNLIYLPSKTKIKFNIYSEDYIYAFSIPEIRLMEMAVPDKTHTLELGPLERGEIKFEAGSFCGFDHETLKGVFVVEKAKSFIKHLSLR